MDLGWTLENGVYLAGAPPLPSGLCLGFTTRQAGDLTDPLARGKLARLLGATSVRIPTQIHSIDLADPELTGDEEKADGWLGKAQSGVLLAVKCADCLPVLLWTSDATQLAAVHAGWRGATGGICRIAVEKLAVPPGDIYAALGPAIGKCCYEVGEEVAAAAVAHPETLIPKGSGKYQFDLSGYARLDLLRAGIPAQNIRQLDHCTSCRGESYASHRARGDVSRQCGFIGLIP